MSIHEQVAAIRANDERVMQQFYVDNYAPVQLFVLQNNGTTDDAKDIYQEAYLSMWRNIQLDKFHPEHEGALEAYLFRIARNKWLDQLRTLRNKNNSSLEPEHEKLMTFEEIDDDTESRIKMLKAGFRQLGENCRKLLKRFYYKKEPLKLIAEDNNWTEATAKNNKYRCMEKLRNIIL
jgi:RNA polymerase sigma factor (sigma-70 family)